MSGEGRPELEPLDGSGLRIVIVAGLWHNTIADGLARVEGHAGEAIGRGIRDELEVRRAAPDDHAEGDHPIRSRLERGLRDHRQLEAARHPEHLDLGTGCGKRAQGARQQPLRDAFMPGAGDHGDAHTRAVGVEFGGASVAAHSVPPGVIAVRRSTSA
jgi:hypothetical protein